MKLQTLLFLFIASFITFMGVGSKTETSAKTFEKPRKNNSTWRSVYEPLGCFADEVPPRRALPDLIQRFPELLNWSDMNNSFTAIVRACALKVYNDTDFQYFAIQWYFECWSGENGHETNNRHGKSDRCLSEYGVGGRWSNFVYRFIAVNGSWSYWSPWEVCNSTSGGNRTLVRTCSNYSSNPSPKSNGLDCSGSASFSSSECETSTSQESISSKSSFHLVGLGLGGALLVLFSCIAGVCCVFKYKRKKRSHSELKEQWEVVFDDISLSEIIGEGAFGKVYRAHLLKQHDATNNNNQLTPSARKKSSSKSQVAVKMLRNGAGEEEKQDFFEEIQLMKQIGYHQNIVNILACCTVAVPMFLVVEFAKYGDLLHFLRNRRAQLKQLLKETENEELCHTKYGAARMMKEPNLYENSSTQASGVLSYQKIQRETGSETASLKSVVTSFDDDALCPADLLSFAWQIAKGMEFLSRKDFVHRDLAARNVLVCEGKLVKIADFGLSRYVYTEKMYQGQRGRKLPIRWMSPEAIHDQVFTTQSDMWAYGILLWEIFTIGGTPYPGISNQLLLRVLNSGYRMEKPQTCSDEIYQLMCMCWQDNPAERPTFQYIRDKLEEMMLLQSPYLEVHDVNFRDAPCCDSESSSEEIRITSL